MAITKQRIEPSQEYLITLMHIKDNQCKIIWKTGALLKYTKIVTNRIMPFL